jgi:hypothetical protein
MLLNLLWAFGPTRRLLLRERHRTIEWACKRLLENYSSSGAPLDELLVIPRDDILLALHQAQRELGR